MFFNICCTHLLL